jgi:hypothetical protein
MLPMGDVAPAVFGVAAFAPEGDNVSHETPDWRRTERTHHSTHHRVRHTAHSGIRSHFV